jgi:HD-like signal output (HDOD) protein
MNASAYVRIKASHQLPSPTGVALRILQLARNDDSTVEQIAVAVESDPAIASRLLKVVNSPLIGMPRQIASVRRAVALSGVRAVTSLALGFSLVSDHRKGKCSSFEYELFWSDSAARAVAARHLAHHLRGFAPDEAFTCGLLCQIGRLALATAFPEEYSRVLRTATHDDGDEFLEQEKSAFGLNHNELAAEWMADWYLPAVFCDAVRNQTAPDAGTLNEDSRALRFARILHFTRSIALVLTSPTVYRDTLSTLAEEAHHLGITPYVCHEMLDAIAREWLEVGDILSVRARPVPPLAEIYAQARERQEDLVENANERRPFGAVEVRHVGR